MSLPNSKNEITRLPSHGSPKVLQQLNFFTIMDLLRLRSTGNLEHEYYGVEFAFLDHRLFEVQEQREVNAAQVSLIRPRLR